MYLKALEIQGFKSFPDKTRITFEKDITAIVGPNGSGKSNIADAILWVLGEQSSKTLRGGKMEDVIFGGTERRSPLGFAQVSLVIDNSARILGLDSAEVMLTRRYYRSGESEYSINRELVRLKDITELLMDTGLGRDGYSVIGQGRIAEIVSAKSSERRDIFEEAAGISRYRYRKEEAERKLARTEENLLRVGDKLEELELQVGPLREQSETAKRYLLLRDELRVVEVSLWLHNLDRLHDSARETQLAYEEQMSARARAQEELDQIYLEAERLAEEMRGRDLEAERARAALAEAETAIAECDSAIAVLRSVRGGNAENLERLHREISELGDKTGSLDERIRQHRERVAAIETERAGLEAEISGVLLRVRDNDDQTQGKQREISGLLAEDSAIADSLSQNRTELRLLAENSQELLDREAGNLSSHSEIKCRQAQAQTDFKAAEEALAEAAEKAESLGNVISGYKLRTAGREEKARSLLDERTRLTIDLKSADSRIALLAEMERELEGFGKSVKVVMGEASRGTLRGICGPVANLVKAEDRYALAIETALGGAMQNIVVETQENGKEAIELLKKRDAGRATFLPLNVVRGEPLHRPPEGEDGYLGLALDMARFDEKYREVFSSLLGKTVLAETLADAVRIARKYANRLRIVTLDGQLISAGGSMTGGSAARNTGIISRANELSRLREQRLRLKAQEESVAQKLQEAERELAAAKYEMDVAAGEYAEAREAALKREAEVSERRMALSNLEDSLGALEREKTDLAVKIRENGEKVDQTRERIKSLESEQSGLSEKLSALTQDREETERLREELANELSALRERMASLSAEGETTQSAADQLEHLLRDLSRDSESRRNSLEEIEARDRDLLDELAAKEESLGELNAGAQRQREGIAAVAAAKMALEGSRTAAEKAAQEKNKALIDLEREGARLEQSKLAFDLEEKQIVDKLWDSYGLSHSAAQAVRQPVESAPKLGKRVSELKREISALGTPNIGAIEEYERVSQRYEFLKSQYDDVVKAKGELTKIIADITQEMQEIFLREFKAIDASFRQTFLELFGGGKAALELDDADDVLNCGIEIRVQPPGKALSTISLMSGGEMAFVAIALYFAILKVRPTPFCVMDEIEAALDESNVTRFAEYMRNMAHSTQFIVITHRRGTMEEADTLYGVTMQEKGVSKVISVDLDEAVNS